MKLTSLKDLVECHDSNHKSYHLKGWLESSLNGIYVFEIGFAFIALEHFFFF